MKKENEQYIINGVGNYQLCVVKENGNHSFIIPLNYIREDKIIKSKNKQFLVLRHAFIEDINFINYALNNKDLISFDINANHELTNRGLWNGCRGLSKFKGNLVYISLEQDMESCGTYKIIIELSESNFLYEFKII